MGRTPRNYSGILSPGKKIGDLLPQFLDDLSRKSGNESESVFRLWADLLGEKMGPLTECISWVDHILTVKVKSATLYSLLCTHEKVRLLKKLQEKFPVRNLVLRIG